MGHRQEANTICRPRSHSFQVGICFGTISPGSVAVIKREIGLGLPTLALRLRATLGGDLLGAMVRSKDAQEMRLEKKIGGWEKAAISHEPALSKRTAAENEGSVPQFPNSDYSTRGSARAADNQILGSEVPIARFDPDNAERLCLTEEVRSRIKAFKQLMTETIGTTQRSWTSPAMAMSAAAVDQKI
mgnify:CR=1 FL=1